MLNKSMAELKEEKTEILQQLGDAMTGDDTEKVESAFVALCDHIQSSVMAEARGLKDAIDTTILASRGNQQLTSEETEYYQKVIKAMKSANPKMELSNIDVAMPKTIIDRVFEDLEQGHPLLAAIDFQNITAISEFIYNAHENQLAQWGDLTDEIVKEILSGFKKIDMSQYKLSAFMAVGSAMLDLGPVWIDRYVRVVLAEAIALALEEAILVGDGNKKPIGMNRSVADNVTITAGAYPVRALKKLDSLDPKTYGKFVADNLASTASGNPRIVNQILLVCNPVDYLTKIMPATTIRTPGGEYVNNVFPLPTAVVQSTRVPAGKAIFGIANRYFMGLGVGESGSGGTGQGGKIEHSDEYRFLEDQRVYRIKLYGNGRPVDDCSFAWTDISDLEPLIQEVRVVNFSDIPATVPEA